jgi:hypothetical protein
VVLRTSVWPFRLLGAQNRVDRRRRVTVHGRDHVAVCVEGEGDRGVPKHLADELELSSFRKQDGRYSCLP